MPIADRLYFNNLTGFGLVKTSGLYDAEAKTGYVKEMVGSA
jgi:hypothetical protein